MKTYLTMLAGDTGPDTSGLQDFGTDKILPLVLIVVGIGVIATARKAKLSEHLGTFAIVILGCLIIAGGGAFLAFGDSLASLLPS